MSNANSLDDSDCTDFEFIFARGSGQKLNDSDYNAYKSAIEKKLGDESFSFYELGSKAGGYPAVSASFTVSLGAIISAGESYNFGDSVEKGTKELIDRVKSESKRCKKKKFILSGYSQGAVVIDKSLNYINSEKIFYIANFGDPKLYLPEGKRACRNIGLSNYRVYVPDCNVEEGVLDGLNPYQPAGYNNKLGVWCNQSDIICGSNLNLLNPLKGHTSYNSENGYEKFAALIHEKITSITNELKPTDARYSDSRKRDIAIIYDFSEMANYEFRQKGSSIRDDLKARLIELASHGTRIAVYNSYNLDTPTKYLEKKIEFTNDNLGAKIDEYNKGNKMVIGYIFGCSQNIFMDINKVIKTANWSPGSEKNIYVLTNTVHSSFYSADGSGFEDVIELAKKEKVKISFLSEDGIEQNYQFQDILAATGGISIGKDYSKIELNRNQAKKLFSKTFEINQDSERTLVVINGAVYGLSDKKSITITNLNLSRENAISLTGYDRAGNKKNTRTINIHSSKIKAPDAGAL